MSESSIAFISNAADLAAMVAGVGHAVVLRPDGEIEELGLSTAARLAEREPFLVAHGPLTARRLGIGRFRCFDILELFAFVRPAQFCLPSPSGLAGLFGLAAPEDLVDEASVLPMVAGHLLAELGRAREARTSLPGGLKRLPRRC